MPRSYGFVRSIFIALIFFAIGRLLVMQFGIDLGGVIVGVTLVFYVLWIWFYRRKRASERKRGDQPSPQSEKKK